MVVHVQIFNSKFCVGRLIGQCLILVLSCAIKNLNVIVVKVSIFNRKPLQRLLKTIDVETNKRKDTSNAFLDRFFNNEKKLETSSRGAPFLEVPSEALTIESCFTATET